MSQPIAALTRAILQLCARPEGMRNAPQDRAELERMTGKPARAQDCSPRLRRLEARHQITGHRNARCVTYTITLAGRGLLARRERQDMPHRRPRRKPAPQSAAQRLTWAKAPMVGSPMPVPMPVHIPAQGVSCGIDSRYQCDPSYRGELSAAGIGRYATEAGSCAARAVELRDGVTHA